MIRLIAVMIIFAPIAYISAKSTGDPVNGMRLFTACSSCHQIGDTIDNQKGPHLNGIIGRKAGSVEGFNFSENLINSGIIWSEVQLDNFLKDPQGTIPGNKMVYEGMSDGLERLDLIAYMANYGKQNFSSLQMTSPVVKSILELDGDVEYGEYLSSECTACHASGGEGIPKIMGMEPEYFVPSLVAYREGTRKHQVMEMLAGRLGDEEIAALAKFYSQYNP